MSSYVIGDIQGCFDELMLLLEKINFDPKKDELIFAGDLINRGPKSLEVLEFCLANKKDYIYFYLSGILRENPYL